MGGFNSSPGGIAPIGVGLFLEGLGETRSYRFLIRPDLLRGIFLRPKVKESLLGLERISEFKIPKIIKRPGILSQARIEEGLLHYRPQAISISPF